MTPQRLYLLYLHTLAGRRFACQLSVSTGTEVPDWMPDDNRLPQAFTWALTSLTLGSAKEELGRREEVAYMPIFYADISSMSTLK